jgi:hypothetical protein
LHSGHTFTLYPFKEAGRFVPLIKFFYGQGGGNSGESLSAFAGLFSKSIIVAAEKADNPSLFMASLRDMGFPFMISSEAFCFLVSFTF